MPQIHLGVASGTNRINYVTGRVGGTWQLNNSAFQTKQAALDVCAEVLHRHSNDYKTTTTSHTYAAADRNKFARARDTLVNTYAAVLGGFSVTDPSSAPSTVNVDSTTWTYLAPWPFVMAVLEMGEHLDARAALQ